MDKFKQLEEYVAILTAQHDMGYNLGVEEIFFNIWRKRQEVNYRFLGRKLMNLMAGQIDKEREGILNTRPLPSP